MNFMTSLIRVFLGILVFTTAILSPLNARFRMVNFLLVNPPSDLVATAESSSSISLTWTDNSTGEIGFVIEISTSESGFVEKGEVAIGVIAFLAEDLPDPSMTYYFRVVPKGTTDYSNTASATTDDPEPPSDLMAGTLTSNFCRA